MTTTYITMPSSQITPRGARTLMDRTLRQLDLRVSSTSRRRTDDATRAETEVWIVNVTDAIRLQNLLVDLRPDSEVTRNVDTRDGVIARHRVVIKW